jgi:hypothetical protein
VKGAAQTDLGLDLENGGAFEFGSVEVKWLRVDEKVIELCHAGKSYPVREEGAGKQGNARFYVPGIFKVGSDGTQRLFQARSLREVARQLVEFEGQIVSRIAEVRAEVRADIQEVVDHMDDRFERIEKTITTGSSPRRSGKLKLCEKPVAVTWEQGRFVPGEAGPGLFARATDGVIGASAYMSKPEFRVFLTVMRFAWKTGLCWAGKDQIATVANVGPSHVRPCLSSLVNQALIRPTGRRTRQGAMEYELLRHPIHQSHAEEELPIDGGTTVVPPRGQLCAGRGTTVVPHKSEKTIRVVVDPARPGRGQPRGDDDDDEFCSLGKRELEEKCLALGVDLKDEGKKWRKWSTERNRSTDETRWCLWLRQLLKGKPYPPKGPAVIRPPADQEAPADEKMGKEVSGSLKQFREKLAGHPAA